MADRHVLDASAVLCLLNAEPGAEAVRGAIGEAAISAVNYSEVIAKIVERGGSPGRARAMLDRLHLTVVPFDQGAAVEAGALRAATRSTGLSFGDRACLALAIDLDLPVLTTDRAWLDLDLNVTINAVR